MGLTKSPVGVPWNLGIDQLSAEETRIYTDRLAEAWVRDQRRRAVLERSGLPSNFIRAAWKTAAVALWGHTCLEMQAAAGQQGWSVRQVAAMHSRAYKAVNRMRFEEWERFIIEAVIPMLRESVPEGYVDIVEAKGHALNFRPRVEEVIGNQRAVDWVMAWVDLNPAPSADRVLVVQHFATPRGPPRAWWEEGRSIPALSPYYQCSWESDPVRIEVARRSSFCNVITQHPFDG